MLLRHRFAVLLSALALLLIGAPLVPVLGPGLHPRLASLIVPLLFTVMLLSVVLAVSRTRATEIIALSLAIPTVILQGLQPWLASDGLAMAGHIFGMLFLAYAIAIIMKRLFTDRRISGDMICASLCVYLLFGVLCALVYSLIFYLDSTSFAFSFTEANNVQHMQFGGERTFVAIYYSFVTMSTLGYGDIVPTSSVARMCAAMQAVTGQLYLAVLVARLVGLHISQAGENKHEVSSNG